jgi:ribosome biogenesis protein MAK21
MDDLRGEVQKILAGRSDGGGSVDPFNERNEWEDAKRGGKGPKAAQPEQPDKPKSRRAQQAAAREAAKPVDPKAEAEKAAKASAKATQNRRPQPVNVPAEAAWKPKPNAGPVLLPVCASWWEEVAPAAGADAGSERASDDQFRQWRIQAEALYERELGAFASRQEKTHGADHRMVQRLLQSGTWKDRIAALTVQAQESAYHALPWVKQLLALAQRPARDVQVKAIEALAELFLARLLPPRRLRTFEKQPLGAAASERQLLEAWYEEGLKHVYAGFAQLVVHGTSDNVLHSKQLMVRMLANMLGGAPELERELLPALVNKLGDPEKKVASRLTHLMHALLQQHPAMKPVLLAEVQRFVLRPGMAERALYYACTFLNQLVLSRREPEVAQQLLA